MKNPEKIGDYEIIEQIGRGGMSTVYLARDPYAHGREVAVKVMRAQLLERAGSHEQFKQEARILKELDRPPGIIPIYNYGEFEVNGEKQFYLVMRYMNGGTLFDRIDQQPLTESEIKDTLHRITQGVDLIHQHQIVHRDLKSKNILFDNSGPTGKAYIADFGIAYADTTLSSPGLLGTLGTPRYMSPEQIEKGIADFRSDIYALGIILFEMLTGDLPYDATTTLHIYNTIYHEDIPLVTDLRDDLPTGYNYIVRKATRRNPDERFQTARELYEAFLRVDEMPHWETLDNPQTTTLIAKPAETTTRKVEDEQNNPPSRYIWRVLLLLLLIGGAIAAAGFWWQNNQNNELTLVSLQGTPTAVEEKILVEVPPPASPLSPTATTEAISETVSALASPEATIQSTLSPTLTSPPTPIPTLEALPITTANMENLSVEQTLALDTPSLRAVTLSATGDVAAVATSSGIDIYDVNTWDLVTTLNIDNLGFRTISWSPNGGFLASGTDTGQLIIWETTTWTSARTVGSIPITALAWSPDEQFLLVGNEAGQVQQWQTGGDPTAVATWNNHRSAITTLAWHPAGKQFVSASNDDQMWFITLDNSSSPQAIYAHQGGVFTLAWNADGQRLLSGGGDQNVRLWDPADWSNLIVTSHSAPVTSLSWPEPTTIVSGDAAGYLRARDLSAEQTIWQTIHHAEVNQIFWQAYNNQILTVGGRDQTLNQWQLDDGSLTNSLIYYSLPTEAALVAYHPTEPDLLAVATDEGIIRIWSMSEKRIVVLLGGHAGTVSAMSWSPDGSALVSSGRTDLSLRLWNTAVGSLEAEWGDHTDLITAVVWSPDGTQIVSGSRDGNIRFWDAETQTRRFNFRSSVGDVYDLDWASAGDLLAVGGDQGGLQVWNVTSQLSQAIVTAHTGAVQSVQWSPDGTQLATIGAVDGLLLLWPNGVLIEPNATTMGISMRTVRWSPSANLLAIAAGNRTVYMLDSTNTTQQTTRPIHPLVGNADWAANGQQLATISEAGEVDIWQVLDAD